MLTFTAIIQPQKTTIGWVHVILPAEIALQLNPNKKKSFKVKGKIDNYAVERLSLLPAGEGDYFLPLNVTIRKAIQKQPTNLVTLQLALDTSETSMPEDFKESLLYEPEAHDFFMNGITQGHRNYFVHWIASAKTIDTRIKRIAETVTALSQKMGYPEMIRSRKNKKA